MRVVSMHPGRDMHIRGESHALRFRIVASVLVAPVNQAVLAFCGSVSLLLLMSALPRIAYSRASTHLDPECRWIMTSWPTLWICHAYGLPVVLLAGMFSLPDVQETGTSCVALILIRCRRINDTL